jgi:uncharacterized protein YggU (UPF0235/DUF167 family)
MDILQLFEHHSFKPQIIQSGPKKLILTLSIWAKPSSKVERITPGPGGEVVLYVHSKPVDGAANEDIIRMISDLFGIPKSAISLESGHKSKFKKVKLIFNFSEKDEGFFVERIIQKFGKYKW